MLKERLEIRESGMEEMRDLGTVPWWEARPGEQGSF
jgi:hypothetical protein